MISLPTLRVEDVLSCQDHLLNLKDPQIDLHLLRSCLGLFNINYKVGFFFQPLHKFN